MDHSVSFTSDIQRALQLAVGEANNPFIQSQSHKGSKKKRARNDGHGGDEVRMEKKQKKTSAASTDLEDNEHASQKLVQTSTTSQVREDPAQSTKGKGRQVPLTTNEVEQQDLLVDSQHASSAAFLNAVVAAASATSEAQPMDLAPYQPHSSYQEPQIMPDQGAPYIQYPSVHYGFHDPSQFGHPPPQAQPMFTELSGPIPDFQFASNDEIIRALHDMDASKIASVLKTLGGAAAANAPMNGPSFIPPPPPPPLGAVTMVRSQPPVNMPSTSTAPLLSSVQKSTKSSHKRVLDMSLPGPDQINPVHAHILANKWMNASKLAELVKTQGLVYKKGKFSAIEERQLKDAIEAFKASRGLTDDQVLEIIFQKNEKGKANAFWSEITVTVPQRPIIAVYHHVRRAFHPKKQQGKWMPEEDNVLKQAVASLGQQWEKVSEIVGRMSSDCRDRYRNHIANREVRITGPWSKEEEEELTRIVTEMTVNQGKDFDNDVFWGIVSDKMNNRRGRQQCRIKWCYPSSASAL
ncbi:hypothetical protein PAXRUDRAFT_822063 [Paxillus rubicundulus Ve08.2h10]|uniref:Uncharacterized protein n=1 Tax=Paxillus rubicundulus Ve08.2h10 TaxID=930991 RepID=A0A0D0DX43_9AGAM|nr:hypothetical protein PAXRUDRAFT_822063 [Paxillus rubicundulus Ve08.2h10]